MLVGIGLSAFYWLPLALEWQLVSGELAVEATYFPVPRWTLGQILGLVRPNDNIRYGVDPVVLVLTAASSLALIAGRRRVMAAEWRFVASLWTWVAVGVFFMHPVSQWVWDTLPLLYRVQFPWRFLLVLTVATAGLAGCICGPTRTWAAVGILALLVHVAEWRPIRVFRPYPYPDKASDMVRMNVAPDVLGEWMPRGARQLSGGVKATCSKPCVVTVTGRGAGRLSVLVFASEATLVTLPHYYFPVGWTATFNGQPVTLEAGELGQSRARVLHDADEAARRRGLGVRLTSMGRGRGAGGTPRGKALARELWHRCQRCILGTHPSHRAPVARP
jgi:hypothetical protein